MLAHRALSRGFLCGRTADAAARWASAVIRQCRSQRQEAGCGTPGGDCRWARSSRRKAKGAEPTFAKCADDFLAGRDKAWRNAKHRKQWSRTLKHYCAPIRDKKVSEISTHHVLMILKPIWQSRAETASRLRGRIERVLDFAKAQGWRTGENPAIWRGHLKTSCLPSRGIATMPR